MIKWILIKNQYDIFNLHIIMAKICNIISFIKYFRF